MCQREDMPKRSSTKKDINENAFSVVRLATEGDKLIPEPKQEKNPAAVALGRLGGLKGGKARAEKLSVEQRREIAKNAAIERWSKKSTQGM